MIAIVPVTAIPYDGAEREESWKTRTSAIQPSTNAKINREDADEVAGTLVHARSVLPWPRARPCCNEPPS